MATHLPAAASLSALIMAAALGQTVFHDPVVMPAVHKLSDWLRERTSEIIEGCTLLASDGTTIFTPDATHSYGAQWTRDFQYLVECSPELLAKDTTQRAIRYTFQGQRSDGCMPDRVQADGRSVYGPGAASSPAADHAIDNMPFAALLLTSATDSWPDAPFFCELEPAARKALDFVNRSASTGLVFNDVERPNCTYGFTDTVAKTGELLFSSLLYLDASRRLHAASVRFGCGDSKRYAAEAEQIARSFNQGRLYDPDSRLWLAASVDNALPDVWGSLYLVALNLTTAALRNAAMDELSGRASVARYFRAGQIRHLPYPLTWSRCFGGCPANGTYQNGAYWATPFVYLARAAINTGRESFAAQMITDCISDFQARGIYEDVDDGYPFVYTHHAPCAVHHATYA